MAPFIKSAEFGYTSAAAGALTAVYVTPAVNKALAPYGGFAVSAGDIVLGAAAFVGGMYIDHDGVSAFLIGFGFTFIVEGLLRFVMPNATLFNSVAVASTNSIMAGATQASSTASNRWY